MYYREHSSNSKLLWVDGKASMVDRLVTPALRVFLSWVEKHSRAERGWWWPIIFSFVSFLIIHAHLFFFTNVSIPSRVSCSSAHRAQYIIGSSERRNWFSSSVCRHCLTRCQLKHIILLCLVACEQSIRIDHHRFVSSENLDIPDDRRLDARRC